MPTKIDRSNIANIFRPEMQKALADFARAHGIDVEVGNATYEADGSAVTFKVTLSNRAAADARANEDFRLRGSVLTVGTMFNHAGRRFRVVRWNPRSRRCPVQAADLQGRLCGFSHQYVVAQVEREARLAVTD